MKCCDKEVLTPFCPDCGKLINHQPTLHGLLHELRRRERNSIKRAAECREKIVHNPTWINNADKADKEAVKWMTWADQLEKVIQSEFRNSQ